jgi:glutaredoxin
MRKFILIVAIGAGAWYWDKGGFSFGEEAGAFDENSNPLVWMFTVDNCGKPCDSGRNDLKRRRVSFEEKRIDINNESDENVKLWKSMHSGNRFPLIVAGSEKLVGSDRPEIAGILGMSFGDKYLNKTEKRYFEQHFYADGSPRIVMYATDWCGYCKKLRGEFAANNVDYLEIDVEKSGEQQRISETMGVYGYPTTWVGYARVNGTNLKAVNAALNSY